MVEKTGMNGIVQAKMDNMIAEIERLAANGDYYAMMSGIEIPIEDGEDYE